MSVPPQEPTDAELFAAYHRTDRIRTIVRVVVGAVATVVAVTLGALVTTNTPSSHAIPTPVATSSPSSYPAAPRPTDAEPDADQVSLPAPPPDQPAIVAPVAAVDGTWRIAITASGFQAELDACQWVRMDLSAAAPIVGAHRSCGGAIVLEMAIGDLVSLSGEGLDGSYSVTEARDAHAGDVAATATEGMDAIVILQTCYPGTSGRLRLIALTLVESPPA